ncbi:glutamate racemase [Sporosarcina trichiuri]|uniref:glutamate racemase n=1 Tax=Sporosarcina trichiuri TaxID=3056445 RepID=UPI0025B601F1|nr:glutamate racemase [Sporosarcina sp. 0.2-SM1T-5]WJY28045.1 glutamate racemase [Sporosarcina sp. 0.2-SM1T-5]
MSGTADYPIGIIDSGVGGLTVMKELLERMPEENFIYIGDDARCPYGSRSPQEIIRFTKQLIGALDRFGVKLAVIACNTATAFALDHVRPLFTFPIIGVIDPGARTAVRKSDTKRIAVLGTIGTVKSGAYREAIHGLSPHADVLQLACPTFVPLVEQAVYKTQTADEAVKQALLPLQSESFDTVILGCTHFPLLAPFIRKHLPDGTALVTSGAATADTVIQLLEAEGNRRQSDERGSSRFYTTGNPEHFRTITADWLGIQSPAVGRLTLPVPQ